MKYEINKGHPRYKEAMHMIEIMCRALGVKKGDLMSSTRTRHSKITTAFAAYSWIL